jgi:hypothetical protein
VVIILGGNPEDGYPVMVKATKRPLGRLKHEIVNEAVSGRQEPRVRELSAQPQEAYNHFHLPLPSLQALPAMAAFSKKEEEGISSYYNNKTTVIQEARVFNESPISPRKCRALLTRIVYLLYIGENFGTQEATTLFFGTTKLFQHKDVRS